MFYTSIWTSLSHLITDFSNMLGISFKYARANLKCSSIERTFNMVYIYIDYSMSNPSYRLCHIKWTSVISGILIQD